MTLPGAGEGRDGLEPTADAWSATVAALLGAQGLHVVLVALRGAVLMLRAQAGLLDPRSRALPCCGLLWHYTSAQGVALAGLVHALPRWLG